VRKHKEDKNQKDRFVFHEPVKKGVNWYTEENSFTPFSLQARFYPHIHIPLYIHIQPAGYLYISQTHKKRGNEFRENNEIIVPVVLPVRIYDHPVGFIHHMEFGGGRLSVYDLIGGRSGNIKCIPALPVDCSFDSPVFGGGIILCGIGLLEREQSGVGSRPDDWRSAV
jgi:hypothetical protein